MLLYYAASSEVAWLFLMAYWVAALIVSSLFYARWNRGLGGELHVRGTEPAPGSPVEDLPDQVLRSGPMPVPVFEGDRVTLELRLVSSRGTRGPARMSGRVGDEVLSAAAGLIPASGWSERRVVGPLRRGAIGATGWVIESGDVLGLFARRRRAGDSEVALVLPRFTSLSVSPRARELEASVTAPRAGAGNELFGVREYRPGDPLRRIHWRSSARHGELIVREFEPPGVQTVGILCDPDPPSPEAADQVARLAASEAWDCLQAGGRVVLWSPGSEPTRPDESRSLWALLEWLARYPANPSPLIGEGQGGDAFAIPPPGMTDAIAVTASDSADLMDALGAVRQRGGSVRAWVVGAAQLDAEIPLQRAGLAWPL